MRIRMLIAVLIAVTFSLSAESQQSQSVPIKFLSGDSKVHGQFFTCKGDNPAGTLILVPGWPGNPQDVLGLGSLLAERNINVLVFNPRGMHSSEGTFTFANTLKDIDAALAWLGQPEVQKRFRVDTSKIALGGYSFGGAIAMAYAAAEVNVLRVISIAGNDLGWLIRKMQADSQYSEAIRGMLGSTRTPDGEVRFDLEAGLRELAENQDTFGLRENSSRLAGRAILLFGGWDDSQVTVEDVLLPLYRSLKDVGAADVTLFVYQDDHTFQKVREKLADDIEEWLVSHMEQ